MIVVIADDVSGAAELATAAIDAGYSADVQLRFDGSSQADVLCLSSESRSLPVSEGVERAESMAVAMRELEPVLVYKKCDSLLRGHVVAECEAIARVLGYDDVLLVPANPTRRRTIRGGVYFVAGVPLAESPLASDPEYPRRSSRVDELLGEHSCIRVPDTRFLLDVSEHAHSLDATTLAAGGVDFFAALLRRQERPSEEVAAAPMSGARSALLVCGSKTMAATRAAECDARDIQVFTLSQIIDDINFVDDQLRRCGMICVMPDSEGGNAREISEALARLTEQLLVRTSVDRVMLEGGATAAAVMRALGLEQFHARRSPGAGVGALVPVGLPWQTYYVKPGSYAWPESAWRTMR